MTSPPLTWRAESYPTACSIWPSEDAGGSDPKATRMELGCARQLPGLSPCTDRPWLVLDPVPTGLMVASGGEAAVRAWSRRCRPATGRDSEWKETTHAQVRIEASGDSA